MSGKQTSDLRRSRPIGSSNWVPEVIGAGSVANDLWVLAALLACMWLAVHDRYIADASAGGWKAFWLDKSRLVTLSKVFFIGAIAVCAAIPFAPWLALPVSAALVIAHVCTGIAARPWRQCLLWVESRH